MIPLIKYFCMDKKIASTGIRDRIMVAVRVPYCHEAASSRRKVMPTARVWDFAVVHRVLAYVNSPHTEINVMMMTVAIPGFTMGSITRLKVCHWPAPSILAAYIISLGTPLNCPLMMNTDMGRLVAIYGSMRPSLVSIRSKRDCIM